MNSLRGEAAEATEDIGLDLFETEAAAKPIINVLVEYYKYDNQTELLAGTDRTPSSASSPDRRKIR
eukprot:5991513-Pyramimonas_sp.AAC.1